MHVLKLCGIGVAPHLQERWLIVVEAERLAGIEPLGVPIAPFDLAALQMC